MSYQEPNYSNSPAPAPRMSQRLNLLIVILVVLVAVSLLQPYLQRKRRSSAESATPRLVTPRGDLAEDEKSVIDLFRIASKSVAFISTSAYQQELFDVAETPRGAGTGFVWDQDGHIVTNFHVIESGDHWKVTLSDNSTWDATLVGGEPRRDLAVLRIEAPADRLQPIAIGESNDLLVGQKVFAIGNPFGLDQTLTTGVVSGLERQIRAPGGRTIEGVIQTDAAINPGNSGGPLLDSSGRLIGVNTAIYSPSGTSVGIGFAIPVDIVNRSVPQILRHGRVITPGLGITIVPEPVLQRMNLEGVLVLSVIPGQGAAKAGVVGTTRDAAGNIQLGDLIVSIESRAVKNLNDLYAALDQYEVGDQVRVKVIRQPGTAEAHEQELLVSLQSLPQ